MTATPTPRDGAAVAEHIRLEIERRNLASALTVTYVPEIDRIRVSRLDGNGAVARSIYYAADPSTVPVVLEFLRIEERLARVTRDLAPRDDPA